MFPLTSDAKLGMDPQSATTTIIASKSFSLHKQLVIKT